MIVTNNSNLPKPLVNACQPRKKLAFLTASQTTTSVRQYWLQERYWETLSEDVVDRLWAIYGTGVHKVLEGHGEGGDIIERRVKASVAGKDFSGQTDRATLLPSGGLKLQDWKFTSVWSGIYGSLNDSLEKQLNSLCYLWRLENYKVEQLEGILLFRDWKPMDALRIDDYPSQVMRVPVPLWDFPTQEKYLTDKINLLCQYENVPDAELPVCTEEECWASPAKWKVYKKGYKKAMAGAANFTTEGEAIAFADRQKVPTEMKFFKGESRKCAQYCSSCEVCSYWQKEKGK